MKGWIGNIRRTQGILRKDAYSIEDLSILAKISSYKQKQTYVRFWFSTMAARIRALTKETHHRQTTSR